MEMAENLTKKGHDVTIVTPTDCNKGIYYFFGLIARILFKFGTYGRFLAFEVSSFYRLHFALKKHGDVDVINAHDIGSAYVASKVFGKKVPVVMTCHFNEDPATEIISKKKLKGKGTLLLKKWYRKQFRHIKYYAPVTDYIVSSAKHLYPDGAVLRKIYNGIDVEKINSIPKDASFKNQFQGKKMIMNVGFLERRKNQRFLIEVAALMAKRRKDFVIVIVGQGEDEQLLKDLVVNSGLEENVYFTGPISNIFPVLKCADIYVHTATMEALPRVLIESILARVPTFGFNVGGIPEVLHDGALIDPEISHQDMSRFLGWLLDNDEYLIRLQSHQHNYASEVFEKNKITTIFEEFLEEVIQDHEEKMAIG
jgi:glycosyltransferase involved in cell wall biosynthesis